MGAFEFDQYRALMVALRLANQDVEAAAGNVAAPAATQIGIVTNGRLYLFDGAAWRRAQAGPVAEGDDSTGGMLKVAPGLKNAAGTLEPWRGAATNADALAVLTRAQAAQVAALGMGLAPDGAFDFLRTDGNSGGNLGALRIVLTGIGPVTFDSQTGVAANGSSMPVSGLLGFRDLILQLDVTGVPTGGAPTLDINVMTIADGANWFSIGAFAQIGGATARRILRLAGTVDPGATGKEEAAPATLAASAVRNGPWGDQIRIDRAFAAGGSTGGYTYTVKGILK